MLLKYRISLLAVIFFSIFTFANAQTEAAFGRLTINIKQSKEYPLFWNKLKVWNKDTTMEFNLEGKEKIVIEDLATGQYTGAVYSIFNSNITEAIHVQKNTFVNFNPAKYFESFKDTGSLLDKMKLSDTCYIYFIPGGTNVKAEDYFMLIRDELQDRIVIKNEIGIWHSHIVTETEFAELSKMGRYNNANADNADSGLGVYYLVYRKQLLSRNCGTCMFGWLMRKRVVIPR